MRRAFFLSVFSIFAVACGGGDAENHTSSVAGTTWGERPVMIDEVRETTPDTEATTLVEPEKQLPFRLVLLGDVSCPGRERPCADERVREVVSALNPQAVVFAGDVQYQSHSIEEYENSFLPVWGALREMALAVPGNHEYAEPGAAGFYQAWPENPGRGWWSHEMGGWSVIGVNTNDACAKVGCTVGSEQYVWVDAELQTAHECTVVVGHHPRWSSGVHGNTASLGDLWDMLEMRHVEAYVSGHDHHYERFPGSTTQYVVGTGGAALRKAPENSHPVLTEHGVLVMDLYEDRAAVWFESLNGPKDVHTLECA